MAKKPKRELTATEIAKLEGYRAIRLPVDQIAALLNICKTDLLYAAKKNPAVQRAMDVGRAQASHNIRVTLFELATGKRDSTGKYKVKPDFQALKFWCQTQEGFKAEEAPANPVSVSVGGSNPDVQVSVNTSSVKAILNELDEEY